MINIVEIILNWNIMTYLFGAMAMLGAMKLIMKLTMGR